MTKICYRKEPEKAIEIAEAIKAALPALRLAAMQLDDPLIADPLRQVDWYCDFVVRCASRYVQPIPEF